MSDQHTKPVLNWVRTSTSHREIVVLIHGVGHDLTYWDRQIEALSPTYNVVAFDLPGHGRSTGNPEDWSFSYGADVVVDLIQTLGTSSVHLVGISFGGMIAQVVALTRPDMVRTLTLIGTASSFPAEIRQGMRARAETVRAHGMKAIVDASLQRWLLPETLVRRPDLADRFTKTLLGDDPDTHAAIWDVIAELDLVDRLAEISCPTLVVVGEQDAITPPAVASLLAEAIEGSAMVVIPNASHIVTVEASAAVNAALLSFLRNSAAN